MRTRIAHAAAAVSIALMIAAPRATAATLFTDSFENGAAQWTPSSGTWTVCAEPAGHAYCQSDPTYLPPMSFAGDFGWADYSVQATVNMQDDV
ncbi:MAG TPA: hypothetical protein VEU08_18585, partial [Vicinamibacterales bacterium]|nr:hypothetical protein [Vicinamibacterales bacterium]